MEPPVVRLVRGLVPEQVPVRAGLSEGLIALKAPFPEGERDRRVRVAALHFPDQGREALIRIPGVLSALHDEGAEAKRVPFLGTFEDLFR